MIARNRPHRTRVGKRNQVTIPAAMLRALEVGPGDEVEVKFDSAGTIGITRASDPFERLRELRQEFLREQPEAFTPANNEELVEMIRAARAERFERAHADDQRILRESRELDS